MTAHETHSATTRTLSWVIYGLLLVVAMQAGALCAALGEAHRVTAAVAGVLTRRAVR